MSLFQSPLYKPLVSAIMPTRGRSELALQAVACWQAQTYSVKELIILDDADDPSFPEGIDSMNSIRGIERECIWHSWLFNRRTISEKRNDCCRKAHGEIIVHFDSDDWSAPDRIADQVARLEETGKAVTGYSSILFYDPLAVMFGRCVLDKMSVLGTTLCYLKSYWQQFPFPEPINIGEDNAFMAEANSKGQLAVSEDFQKIVARVHPGNTSPKSISDFRPVHPGMIPWGFPA